MTGLLEIIAEDLRRRRAAGEDFFLIDVREPEEYEAGHIPGALLFPLHLLEERIKGIRHDRALVVYCQHGVRSKVASLTLLRLGFTNVAMLHGGYAAWQEAMADV